MSATTRVVDFPGAQLRATEVKGDKGLFTNVVINGVLAEAATQTLDQVTANGATTTRAISITNTRPGLTQTDAALTVSGGLGVNANVVATNLIARVDGNIESTELTPHKHGLQLFAPGGLSENASLMAGFDATKDCGYINASRSGSMRPLCLQGRGDWSASVGIGTNAPTTLFEAFNGAGNTSYSEVASFRVANNSDHSAWNRLTVAQVAENVMGLETSNVANSKGKLVLQGYGGHVGVGTTNPNCSLDVQGGDIGFDYGRAIVVSPGAFAWPTNKLIEVNWQDNSGDEVRFFTPGAQSGTQKMVINSAGKVGIATTLPITNFDLQLTNNATEPNNRIAFGRDGYWNRMYFGTTHPTSANGANTRVYLRAVSNGTSAPSASSTHDTVEMYLGYIGANSGTITSDDRRKFNEVAIENACDTLNKLKPQVYDKHNFEFDEISIDEASNVSTEGYVLFNEKYVKRRVSDHSRKEAGLIAQDVFYDAPELRYLVKLSDDADPDEEKPETSSEDIQDDPDYDAAGWGTESASIDYNSLIAYLVKANQELDARVRELEKKI